MSQALENVLLRQVRVLDPVATLDQPQDVLFQGGKLRAIAPQLSDIPEGVEEMEAEDLILAPGLVDLYSHCSEPGYESRETLAQLAQGAIAGGFTQVGILPDTNPALDNIGQLNSFQQLVDNLPDPKPNFHPWAAITKKLAGESLTELGELTLGNTCGFSDGHAIDNWNLLRRTLEYLRPLNQPIALFPKNLALQNGGTARYGKASVAYGLIEELVSVETTAIAAICELVAELKTPVHLMRISTARGVELIADAKKRGLPITASVSWMHLLWNTKALSTYDPNLKFDPPLGNPSDQEVLIEAVKTGIIEAIAIDHQPYLYEEKTVSFAEAPSGVIGLELALPILWQNFVVSEDWSPLQLWQALSTNPQKCLGKEVKAIAPEHPQPLILFDPSKTWQVNHKNLHCPQTNTPWWNRSLSGKVTQSFLT
ncbi:dihydroorotase [[Limnothrix rosea] IAM M-220]|uniref:dihydroorotase n=1 Tax=[Limnothrix rosea] IAM M-220 TaxID=454133 RepID=UPI0009696F4C|nr:dihydroorotase [[Limnothrix rosea] IAM M-220]OKH19253.1 dihydroorotase [[Limnothrix rosea] IAM M-220]